MNSEPHMNIAQKSQGSRLPRDWQFARLGALVEIKHGFAFKGEYFCEEPTQWRLTTPGNFAIGGGFQIGKPKYYNGPVPNEYVLKSGDLVVTMTDLSRAADTLGLGAIVPTTAGVTWLHNQRIGLVQIKPDAPVIPEFLHYLMRTEKYRHWVVSSASGSTVKHTSPGRISDYQFLLPPIHIQEEIAGSLRALDDKIALLSETNATLEAIAQALFKSWFVDFDPVRAKAEGRDPEGVPPEVAELFPCEFEESELGAIPKGWRVSSLDKHLDVVRGLSYKGSGLAEPDDTDAIPMHNLNSVLEGGGYKYAGLKFYKGERRPKHEIKAGDIIVANTEQGHDHLLIGYPAVVPVTPHRCELFSHHLYRVRALPGSPLNNLFIYRLLMTPVVREQVVGCSNGTTVNMLKADGLAIPKFICPPKELAAAFEQAVAPFHAQQEDNITQTTSLAVLRDTLLPRLVSGKLAITSKGPLQVTS